MDKYSHDIKTIKTTNIKHFERDLGYYLRLGYFLHGNIVIHTVVKKYFPLRIVTEYTAFMQKIIKMEEPDPRDGVEVVDG